MSTLSRRVFIQDGFKVVSLGLALPHIFTRAVQAAGAEAGRGAGVFHADGESADPLAGRTLIVVQMAGGNDGLNTVVPYTDGKYYEYRKNLGIPADQVLPLDDRFGLHPGMAGMKALWDAGNLAIVHGVGYPNPNYSHFKSMDIWQTANPDGKDGDEGWLARLVKGAVDRRGHPFAGFAAGGTLPPALMSPDYPVPAADNAATFKLLPDSRYAVDTPARQNALVQLYDSYPAGSPFAQVLKSMEQDTLDSIDQLQKAHAAFQPAVEYPKDGFAAGLKLLAETITGELGVKVGYVTIGGFDTHSGQKNQQARLLQSLSDGLKAFWDDLSAQGKADDVLIMTWSEFGRRVAENGSSGTDHGAAAPQFIIGKQVAGGHWGDPVDLNDLDKGNLRFTTDFRSVYSTVMDGWLGAPSQQLLGARYQNLGFLPTNAVG